MNRCSGPRRLAEHGGGSEPLQLRSDTLGLFFLFFASLAFGWWLGDLVNSRAGGFLIAAALFLVILLVIVLRGKKTILPMLRDIIVRKFYD